MDPFGLIYAGTKDGHIEIWTESQKLFDLVGAANGQIIDLFYSKSDTSNKNDSKGTLISVDVGKVYRIFSCENSKIKNTHAIKMSSEFNIEMPLLIDLSSNMLLLSN